MMTPQSDSTAMHAGLLPVFDGGLVEYAAALERQLDLHARVLQGQYPRGAMLLVEHPAVITIGRHPGAEKHLLAAPELLAARGVAVHDTDRGGDITFHGPGQLVAYPIIPLNFYGFGLHDYMRFLEQVVIDLLASFKVKGHRLEGATGVWVYPTERTAPEKICAMGVKLRRWVSFHGLALNITTDLSYFELINPCGLGRPVTSLASELGSACPDMSLVKSRIAAHVEQGLADRLNRPL
ncbi:MAG: lipoyl(octanoyl) transferase LipB [Phycisphaerae bacterium]